MTKTKKPQPLESGLLQALQAIDAQVARALLRTPAQEESLGVRKWEPYAQRIESTAGYLLEQFADQSITLDGMLVVLQSLSKSLSILVDELGPGGLGSVRSEYCRVAFEQVERDTQRVVARLRDQQFSN